MIVQHYLQSIRDALIAPWRIQQSPLACASNGRLAIVAALHMLIAAGICTLSSHWVYLAVKGIVKGAADMDTGERSLPPDSVAQVAFGLIASVVIWFTLLSIVLGVCAFVADWLHLRDGFGFRSTVRRGALLSIWFVLWATLMLAANLEQGDRFIRPARWPTGETWEVRDRLIFLVLVFPIIWAASIPPRYTSTGRPMRIRIVIGALALSWLAWAAIWRVTPWVAIEAYSG